MKYDEREVLFYGIKLRQLGRAHSNEELFSQGMELVELALEASRNEQREVELPPELETLLQGQLNGR